MYIHVSDLYAFLPNISHLSNLPPVVKDGHLTTPLVFPSREAKKTYFCIPTIC